MNLNTLRDNLMRTIEGKEKYLQYLKENNMRSVDGRMANTVTLQFIEINLTELRNILNDVNACITNTGEKS